MSIEDLPPVVFTMVEDNDRFKDEYRVGSPTEHSQDLKAYMDENNLAADASIKIPKYFYEVSFEKPGGLVMPLIVEYTYGDGLKSVLNIQLRFGGKMILKSKKLSLPIKKLLESL